MNILVCYNYGMKRHEVPLKAFANGLKHYDHNVTEIMVSNFRHYFSHKTNLVVIFGSGSQSRGVNALAKYELLRYCEAYDISHVKLEEAYIKRGEYWSVTIDGLARDGEYLHDNLDPDRIDKITTFKPFEWHGDCILLAKQLERDANVGVPPEEYNHWVKDTLRYLKGYAYPIIVREHPKVHLSKETLEIVLKRARYVVTFSSTTAVDAAIAGVPFYTEHPRSIVFDLRVQDINGPLPLYDEQRRVLNEVAHAQWSISEMETGECWQHVKQLEIIKTL